MSNVLAYKTRDRVQACYNFPVMHEHHHAHTLCHVTGHQSVVPLSCVDAELQPIYKAPSLTS